MTIARIAPVSPRFVVSTGDRFDPLRARLAGQLAATGSDGFVAYCASKGFAVQQPQAIVEVADAADIAATVAFAREHGMPVAVRSGGHGLGAHGLVAGAVVVDLARMKRVTIDPVARVARVQAGATTRDLLGPAHEHDLALSTGDTASVGLGGLVTGGGIGFMARKYGLSIDNLLSAQVVTAAGEIVIASEVQHADLFWAIRGGGGNVGIVAEYTFRMAPVGRVLAGLLALPATPEVLRGYLDYASAAPDDLTTIANVMHAPPAPFVPGAWIGKPIVAILACWTGDAEAGERALAPLRALATPVVDTIAEIPYPEIYRYTDAQTVPHPMAMRSMFADDLSDAVVTSILSALDHATSPMSLVQIRGMGGAIARVAPEATAFAHRHQRLSVTAIALWPDFAMDPAPHRVWLEGLWGEIRGEGSGVYVNFLEQEGDARLHEAYPAATYARLAEIKRRYDPTNIFRFNQNIAPSA